MKRLTQKIAFFSFVCLLLPFLSHAQIIVIDAGHGYNTDCSNGDFRTKTEINTNYEVSMRLRNLIANNCNMTPYLTRPANGCGSWVSVSQRALMANNWNADLFLSIHCNAGGGSGSESFWCDLAAPPTPVDQAFATEILTQMTTYGHWNWRRVVEDNTYLNYHLGVLKTLDMTGSLIEIGFVDSPDSNKLLNPAWRDSFALANFIAIQNYLGQPCIGNTTNVLRCDSSITLQCGDSYTGLTSTDSSYVKTYGCNSWTETGPERVHTITLQDSGSIAATISNFTGDLDVYILSNCNANDCIGNVYGKSALYKNAPPGTYYIVVDSDNGSGSGYDLLVNCTNQPDLTTESLIPDSSSVISGDTFPLQHKIINTGGKSAYNFNVYYYLSADSTYDIHDSLLASSFIDSVRATLNFTNNPTIIMPIGLNPGNYFLIAYIDQNLQVNEIIDTNNVFVLPFTIIIDVATSQNISLTFPEINIYPIPADNLIKVNIPHIIKPYTVRIFDLQGQLLKELIIHTPTQEIDIQDFAPGIYNIQFLNTYQKITKKFIKI